MTPCEVSRIGIRAWLRGVNNRFVQDQRFGISISVAALAVAVAPKLPKRTIEEIGVLVDLLIPSLIIVGSRNVHHAGSVQAWFKFLCL